MYLTKNNFIFIPEILEHVFHIVNQMRPAFIGIQLYPLVFYGYPLKAGHVMTSMA